ncbi:uncharacterized protein [Montipora capricornis]|uniref:uncharacterized protein n=1 Tax=Montipora foliosa TaxID=591990 RepID=UPI0035F1472C
MRRIRSCAYDQGQQSKIINVRAVITGLDGVGKSALTLRVLTRRLTGEYDENLGHREEVGGIYFLWRCFLHSLFYHYSFMEARRLGRPFRMLETITALIFWWEP